MSENPTREEVLASIVPRSDQLNSEDCVVTGPITVTVAGVRQGNKEQPIIIDLEGRDRPFKPCKTVRRILIAIWTEDAQKWIGQSITLYCDPDVVYSGVKVGGLRISHATGIDKPKTFMLTKTRGKKAEVVIHPIATMSPEHLALIDEAIGKINAADSLDALSLVGTAIAACPKPVQDAVRPTYAKRLAELTG